MNALSLYECSDGNATRLMYQRLEAMKLQPHGIIGLNIFRAHKCSARAKLYRKRAHKAEAYDRKRWSIGELCRALHRPGHTFVWGWKIDPLEEFNPWVIYIELPTGQVSFHLAQRDSGPDYLGEWDCQHGVGAGRVCSWVQTLLDIAAEGG